VDKQVSVDQLSVGMFVSGLDRPWLDTPFLVQGFLIEDEATIAQLRQMCRHVMVDFSRSNVDDGNRPERRADPSMQGSQVAVRLVPIPVAQPQRAQPQSWLSRLLQGLTETRDSVAQPTADDPSAMRHLREAPSRPAADPLVRSRKGLHSAQAVTQADPVARSQGARLEGAAFGPPGDLLTWLRDSLGQMHFSRSAAASVSDDAQAPPDNPRVKRNAPVIRIYQDSVPIEQELGHANESFARATEMLGTVIREIQVGKGLEIEAFESVVEDLVESIIRHPGALQLVSRLREADESAYTHALQVAVLMVSFGRELGFSRTELGHLGQVGMLLDVGKLRIDQRILSKRGNLTPEEFDEVKRHVQYGLEIIGPSSVAHPDVIQGVAQHHERLNGTGYPKGLKDGEIVPFGQMGGIVDAFSALTSVRPYAEPVSPYEAMQQLQGWGGTYFNAGLVEQFIQAIGIFPVGTLVELSTGEVAVVLEQNRARRLKPKVLVISAPDKTPLKIPATLDLLYGGAALNQMPYIRRGLPTASFAVDPKEYYLSRP